MLLRGREFEAAIAKLDKHHLLILDEIFPDQVMTLAAVDRLVHHATIFEMDVESYRRRTAIERKRGPGRPSTGATITASS